MSILRAGQDGQVGATSGWGPLQRKASPGGVQAGKGASLLLTVLEVMVGSTSYPLASAPW